MNISKPGPERRLLDALMFFLQWQNNTSWPAVGKQTKKCHVASKDDWKKKKPEQTSKRTNLRACQTRTRVNSELLNLLSAYSQFTLKMGSFLSRYLACLHYGTERTNSQTIYSISKMLSVSRIIQFLTGKFHLILSNSLPFLPIIVSAIYHFNVCERFYTPFAMKATTQ